MKLHFLREKKIKFILSLHSTIPRDFKDFLVNFVYTRFFQKRDKVIFICQAQKDYLAKKYLFRPRNWLLIYNGIDTAYFSGCFRAGNTLRQEMRKTYDLSETDKVIVKVARLFREKGHTYAVDALKVLHDKHQCKAHLFFVGAGDDEYEATVRQHTNSKGLSAFVHFTLHQSDVRPFHCMADMFTLTSYTTETFSLTDIGGAAEMINERNGLLSKSKDPDSIAATWLSILNKKYDPVWLHDNVETHFSLPGMIDQYAKVLSPDNHSQ
jgi:glycosyltransferase involved in cell wall biosynthesis